MYVSGTGNIEGYSDVSGCVIITGIKPFAARSAPSRWTVRAKWLLLIREMTCANTLVTFIMVLSSLKGFLLAQDESTRFRRYVLGAFQLLILDKSVFVSKLNCQIMRDKHTCVKFMPTGGVNMAILQDYL